MAYMSQERKKELAPAIKEILKKYGIKGTIGVKHHSSLEVNLKSGVIDFRNYIVGRNPFEGKYYDSVNVYSIESNYTGIAKNFLLELLNAMNNGNYDNSDAMTDYFDVGWYSNIYIGKWDKEYIITD